jgi:hypothetical protein
MEAIGMLPAKIVKDEPEINARLRELFDATPQDFVPIIGAAVTARNDAVDDDPLNAGGTLSYIFGTRGVRGVFRVKGYVIDRKDNIESVYSVAKGNKIIFQNADAACDENHDPNAISGKGPAAVRMIDRAQRNLFPEIEERERKEFEERVKRETAAPWFLCVSNKDGVVRAEISCPRQIADDQFHGFIERIFLVHGDEWQRLSGALRNDGDTTPQEFEPVVIRK